MPDRPQSPARRPSGRAKSAAPTRVAAKRPPSGRAPRAVLALPGATVAVQSLAWFRPLGANIKLPTGAAAPDVLRVPEDEANRVLAATIRLVADVDAAGPRTVVWTQGASELLVDLAGVRLACAAGVVAVTIPVACDQLEKPAAVVVPFAVGTAERPAGLVMSTVDRLAGPAVVVATWSGAITAFAWEALVHVARQLSAAVGRDARGLVLVPASIAAAADVLLVQPMARHQLVPPQRVARPTATSRAGA